jgi:alkanesulfonate monooxygenase SsuD/methylene tetrahydromethanopterin reductase-like flavin-dependent oxidoreductase (luciferase family)
MRISVSLRTSYPISGTSVAAGWIVERTRAARDAGLDALFVGDHHSTGPGPYFQNVPLLGRLLGEWDDRPAGALFLVPLWNPVLMAEQIGTLATMARGRFILQAALGGGGGESAAMGITPPQRVRRFEVGLDLVRRLLAGERVTDDTGTFGVLDAAVAPTPPVPVEVWIGASADPAIDRAARLAEGWVANAPLVPDEARRQVEIYRERCAVHGRAPTTVAIRRDVHVADDPVSAATVHEQAVAAGYRGFHPDALVSGDVEQVAARFAEYAAMGFTEIVVRHFSDDQPAVLRSLALLGVVRGLLR